MTFRERLILKFAENPIQLLFKFEPDGHSAKKVPVQFGVTSVNRIEIKSGLQPGDKLIIIDMSQYEGVAAIVLR
jgi:HlyD family secretion protein